MTWTEAITASPHPQASIEVVNRSSFALTISQVGFQIRWEHAQAP